MRKGQLSLILSPDFSQKYMTVPSLLAEMSSATNDLLGADPLIGLSPEKKELLRRVSTEDSHDTQSFQHTTSSC